MAGEWGYLGVRVALDPESLNNVMKKVVNDVEKFYEQRVKQAADKMAEYIREEYMHNSYLVSDATLDLREKNGRGSGTGALYATGLLAASIQARPTGKLEWTVQPDSTYHYGGNFGKGRAIASNRLAPILELGFNNRYASTGYVFGRPVWNDAWIKHQEEIVKMLTNTGGMIT
jgi:hypothetical protein